MGFVQAATRGSRDSTLQLYTVQLSSLCRLAVLTELLVVAAYIYYSFSYYSKYLLLVRHAPFASGHPVWTSLAEAPSRATLVAGFRAGGSTRAPPPPSGPACRLPTEWPLCPACSVRSSGVKARVGATRDGRILRIALVDQIAARRASRRERCTVA